MPNHVLVLISQVCLVILVVLLHLLAIHAFANILKTEPAKTTNYFAKALPVALIAPTHTVAVVAEKTAAPPATFVPMPLPPMVETPIKLPKPLPKAPVTAKPKPVQAAKAPIAAKPKPMSTPMHAAPSPAMAKASAQVQNTEKKQLSSPVPLLTQPTDAELVIIEPPRFNVRYLNNPSPDYPVLSRRLGETGKVLLKVQVSSAGSPTSVQLQQSSGYARLDEAAIAAVKRWRFVPAKRGDQAIGASVMVPIIFRL